MRQRHRRHQRDVHDLERPLVQIERTPLNEVEHAIRVTSSASEADRLGVAERAVVTEPRRIPVAPGVGVGPAQEVLPATPVLLMHALALGDAQQARELLVRARGVAIGGEARVEAHLVAAAADVPDQRPHPRMLEQVPAIAGPLVAMSEEVERAAQAVALADVHQEVEGVVRIEAPIARQRPQPSARQPGIPPRDKVACELAEDGGARVVERRERIVDVVGQGHLERARPAPQSGPGALQGTPEQLDVRIDDRDAEEAGPARRSRTRRGSARYRSRSATTSSS